MATTIQDGTGKGFQAKVDETNSLKVRSVVEDSTLEGAIEGNTYTIGTPFLTQTGDTVNGLLYFKCEEAVSLFAKTFSSQARWASGATFQNYIINVYLNIDESALTGTWVDFVPLNVNFGSSNELAGVFKYGSPTGAGGFTGLIPKFQLAFPVNVYNQINTNLIFPKGVGILLSITPPSGNVAMPVSFTTQLTKLNYT